MKKLEDTISCWRLQRLLRFDAVREHRVPEASNRSLEGSQSDRSVYFTRKSKRK